jgi:GntR family transcriptional repressor for pyruvate dehydrogenase complex
MAHRGITFGAMMNRADSVGRFCQAVKTMGKPNVRRLRPRPPLHREVAEILSEQIITGELAPSTFLPAERELCSSMGVSRTVIREAIKLLESSGLVSIERGRGTVVLDARQDSVSRPLKILLRRRTDLVAHVLELRKILEVSIVGLAAERRSPENIAAMERSLEIMREKPNEPAGYIDADMDFHAEIARAARNPAFSIVMEPLSDLLRQSRATSFSGPERVDLRRRQHETILECICRGDAAGAREAMRIHLSDTENDLAGQWHFGPANPGKAI